MKILALYPWSHISSSALMINGKVVSASAEERFNKQKWSTVFPLQSAEWCLKSNKLTWKDIDKIVIPWNPAHNINTSNDRWDSTMTWRGQMLSHIPSNLMKAQGGPIANRIETHFDKTKIIYVNHHDCHAASAIFCSPFKKTDYLTIDGHGESETCSYGYFDGKKIIKKGYVLYPHSVGLLYGAFTNFLGFVPDKDEWKTMALASYSIKKNIYDKKIKEIYKLTKNGFELDLTFFDYYLFDKKPNFYNKKLTRIFGQPRLKDDKILKKHHEIAGALQRTFEKIVFHLLEITKRNGSKSGNIAISGGAAMNCVFNGNLDENKIYNENYIPPWPDDLGVSIGATYLLNSEKSKTNYKPKRIRSCYLGPKYSDSEIKSTLDKFKLKYSKSDDICKFAATRLANKKLIGWFQDNMEFTHRALGNRSIIADPRNSKIKDTINKAVKYRESFRPFAPSVLQKYAHSIFHIKEGSTVDYMEKAVKVRSKWIKKIPGTTHVDNSARIQTVSKDYNHKFYKLIENFYEITNIPVVLNTSFNLNGQPIVCDPEDAIKTFFSCGLDILIMGNYYIEKN